MEYKIDNNIDPFSETNVNYDDSNADNTDWNPESISGLLIESEMSCEKAAQSLKIDETELIEYLSGKAPSLDIILRMSDLFDVPVDYLLGRCSKEQAQGLLTNYSDYYLNLRIKNYEYYLQAGNSSPISAEKGVIYQYPYNLLMDIFKNVLEKDPEWIIGSKQLDALENVLSTLTEKEEKYIQYYYKDGMTLAEIGEIEGLTRERIRQVLTKALRKLSHPTRSNRLKDALSVDEYIASVKAIESITEGMNTSEQIHASLKTFDKERIKTSEQERILINNIEKVGECLFCNISEQYRRIADSGSSEKEMCEAIIHSINVLKYMRSILYNEYIDEHEPIDSLGFTKKTYSSLKQAGFNTIGDIADSSCEERTYIKNLTKECFDEINDKMLRIGFQINRAGEFISSYEIKQLKPIKKVKRILETPIEELDLSVRSFNCLKRAGINEIEDILEKSLDGLMKVGNINGKVYNEVIDKLMSLGFELNDETWQYNKDNNSSDYKALIEWLQLSPDSIIKLNDKVLLSLEELVSGERFISIDNVIEVIELMKTLSSYGFSVKFEMNRYYIKHIILDIRKMSELSDNITKINSDEFTDSDIENLQLSNFGMIMMLTNNISSINDLKKLTSDKLLEICCGNRIEYEAIIERLKALEISLPQ